MEELIKSIEKNFTVFFIIVVTSVFSMTVYALSSKEEIKQRVKSMFSGGIIACLLTYPTWLYLGAKEPVLLIPITFAYTITGQFLPEFLQSIVPKIVKKFFSKKVGEDLNNDNH